MHVFDHVLGSFSRLFRPHRYGPMEKVYAAVLFIAGLSLRDISERYFLTGASRESVGRWAHRLGMLFRPGRRPRRVVAVDETVEKVYDGQYTYGLDLYSGEIIAVYASWSMSLLTALIFLRRFLDSCDGRPIIVVDRGPWYPWALKRLGISYIQETLGRRSRIERWFRELKQRTKRF